MLKNKSKLVVLLIAIIMLVSTISFATDDATALTAEPTNEELTATTTEGEVNEIDTTMPEPEPEIHNGDLYLFDNNVVMDQLVDGNVFIFGQNVEITGRINGSLFVFGNKVTFSENSYVVQSVYVAANEVVLNGAANDLYAVANKVDMAYNSFIIRDLRIAANTFNFKGGVGRDAFVEASNFNFEKEADSAAIVYGNLTYSSSKELELSKELVQGDITYSKQIANTQTESVQEIILNKVINLFETLLFTAAIFFLMAWLAPKFVEKSADFIGKKTFVAFGIGLAAFVVSIVVSFALLFSYIGVPLAFTIFGIFALMMSISFAVTATCITFKAKEKFKFSKKYLTIVTLAVVTLILWALQQIPYVGAVISIIITLVGFGTMLVYLFKRNRKDAKVVETK